MDTKIRAAQAFKHGQYQECLEMLLEIQKSATGGLRDKIEHNIQVVEQKLQRKHNPSSTSFSEYKEAVACFHSADYERALELLQFGGREESPILTLNSLLLELDIRLALGQTEKCRGLLNAISVQAHPDLFRISKSKVVAAEGGHVDLAEAFEFDDLSFQFKKDIAEFAEPADAVALLDSTDPVDVFNLAVLNIRWLRYAGALLFLDKAQELCGPLHSRLRKDIANARMWCRYMLGDTTVAPTGRETESNKPLFRKIT